MTFTVLITSIMEQLYYTRVCVCVGGGGVCERVRLYMLDCTELCNKMSFAL